MPRQPPRSRHRAGGGKTNTSERGAEAERVLGGGAAPAISIDRAPAREPGLLIADEAVSALDVSVQAQILTLLEEIQRLTSIGILAITHDLRVASQICDRVIVMHEGRIVEEGLISDVFFAPREDYTRRLLAAVSGRDFSFALPAEAPQDPGMSQKPARPGS